MEPEMKFQAGDKVIYTEDDTGLLAFGREYTVEKRCYHDHGNHLVGIGTEDTWWYDHRFRSAQVCSPGPELESAEEPREAVHRPNHYTRFEIEPIEFIMRNKMEFWQGNVIKYTCRYDAKNGIEDLRKAVRYLEMQIKKLESNEEFAK